MSDCGPDLCGAESIQLCPRGIGGRYGTPCDDDCSGDASPHLYGYAHPHPHPDSDGYCYVHPGSDDILSPPDVHGYTDKTPCPPPPGGRPVAAAPPATPTPSRGVLCPLALGTPGWTLWGAHRPARAAPGSHWRLVSASWANEKQSAGKHSIYVEVLGADGKRKVGQPVVFQWPAGSLTLLIEDRPPPDWGANFPMYAALGSYSASVVGAPSDKVVGMGLGTVEAPAFTVHTTFYLTFQWVGG